LFCCIGDVSGSGIRPPPGEGSGNWRGLDGNSPNGDDGESELYELDVDIEVGALFRNSPLPSSDLPEPDLEFLSKFSPFLVLLLLPHMIVDHQSPSLVSWL